MKKAMSRVVSATITTLLVTGCNPIFTDTSPSDDLHETPKGAISLLLGTSQEELAGFLFSIYQGEQHIQDIYKTLRNESGPEHPLLQESKAHRFTDAYMVLAPETYTIRITPMQSETEIGGPCLAAEQELDVEAFVTSEVVMLLSCHQGEETFDVKVAQNRYPIITNLDYNPSNASETCLDSTVTVVAEDPDQDPIRFFWDFISVPNQAQYTHTINENQLTINAKTVGDYEIKVTVCDSHDLCTYLKFPIHILLGTDTNNNGIGDECDPQCSAGECADDGPDFQSDQPGRILTILLTMSNPIMAEHPNNVAFQLANNAVKWVSDSSGPSILVVRDDNHRGEFPDDPAFIHITLLQSGFFADIIDEPENGLTPQDVEGYDVVWFSNPGYPVDDLQSMQTLIQFSQNGGGVVLQGDDMSWKSEMQPLTHLSHINNGTSYCGVNTDNNNYENYQVTTENSQHAVLDGIRNIQFEYGDDIDTSTPLGQGETILAWANVDSSTQTCSDKPVIVAVDPQSL